MLLANEYCELEMTESELECEQEAARLLLIPIVSIFVCLCCQRTNTLS